MTFLDGARFLIACAATDHPEQAADAELVFSGLQYTDQHGYEPPFASSIAEAKTLDHALALTLEMLADGRIDNHADDEWSQEHPNLPRAMSRVYVYLILHRNGVGATIRVQSCFYKFTHPALVELMNVGDVGGYPAQKAVMGAFERETHRFRTGKNLKAELELPLLRAVADLIAGKAEKARA